MKAAVYITPLIALAAAPVAAELDTMTIQNLPLSAEENRLVCYDSASGNRWEPVPQRCNHHQRKDRPVGVWRQGGADPGQRRQLLRYR